MAPADFRATRPIALVGLMGAGKTTVGRRLAARLGLPFVDSDAAIEQAEGMSIAEMFDSRGEPAFRARERRAIAALADGSRRVIAVGGGAFADDGNRSLLLERSLVVWLDAPVEILAGRLAGGSDRPLLRGPDPEAALGALAAARATFYGEAHVRVSAEAPVDAVVEQIVAAVAARS
jgi:shikimate kinase